jgi:hypothetical protein
MGASRPLIRREVWGQGHPAHLMGGMFQKIFSGPFRGFFANKRWSRLPSRPSPAHRMDHRMQEVPSIMHAEHSPESTVQLASNPTGETFLEHRRQTSEAPFLQEEVPLPSSA